MSAPVFRPGQVIKAMRYGVPVDALVMRVVAANGRPLAQRYFYDVRLRSNRNPGAWNRTASIYGEKVLLDLQRVAQEFLGEVSP